MSSVSRGSTEGHWSTSLGAPGSITFHPLEPSASKGAGWELPFLPPFVGGEGIHSSCVPLVYIWSTFWVLFPWLSIHLGGV